MSRWTSLCLGSPDSPSEEQLQEQMAIENFQRILVEIALCQSNIAHISSIVEIALVLRVVCMDHRLHDEHKRFQNFLHTISNHITRVLMQ